jgi:hypothetical protein
MHIRGAFPCYRCWSTLFWLTGSNICHPNCRSSLHGICICGIRYAGPHFAAIASSVYLSFFLPSHATSDLSQKTQQNQGALVCRGKGHRSFHTAILNACHKRLPGKSLPDLHLMERHCHASRALAARQTALVAAWTRQLAALQAACTAALSLTHTQFLSSAEAAAKVHFLKATATAGCDVRVHHA